MNMNAKVIKAVSGELLDEQMRLMPCAVTMEELEALLNSCANSAPAFEAWQFFCGRLYLQECGKNPARN